MPSRSGLLGRRQASDRAPLTAQQGQVTESTTRLHIYWLGPPELILGADVLMPRMVVRWQVGRGYFLAGGAFPSAFLMSNFAGCSWNRTHGPDGSQPLVCL